MGAGEFGFKDTESNIRSGFVGTVFVIHEFTNPAALYSNIPNLPLVIEAVLLVVTHRLVSNHNSLAL